MSSSRPRRPGESPGVIALTTALVVGVTVMLAGTFLPWLASGAEQRNVYGASGVVERIAELAQPMGYVVDVLPLVGLMLVLCGALWVVGRRAVAGIAIAVVTALLGVIAGAALAHQSSGTVRIVALGPMITLAGVGITALSLALLPVLGRRATAEHRAVITGTSKDPSESSPPDRSSRMELT